VVLGPGEPGRESPRVLRPRATGREQVSCSFSPLLGRRGGSDRLGMEHVEVEAFVELGQLPLEADGEELVAEVHHDAEVPGRVLGEGGFQLGRHQRPVAGGIEEMVEACAEGDALGVVEVKAATNSTAEGKQVWMAEAVGQARVPRADDA